MKKISVIDVYVDIFIFNAVLIIILRLRISLLCNTVEYNEMSTGVFVVAAIKYDT